MEAATRALWLTEEAGNGLTIALSEEVVVTIALSEEEEMVVPLMIEFRSVTIARAPVAALELA